MAQNRLGGPGLGLSYPQALYPASLVGAAPTASTAEITLAPGQAIPIPAGDWLLNVGSYTFVQYLDPVTGIWQGFTSEPGVNYVHSDGQNHRIANLTGCPIGAIVTAAGATYVSGSVTVTASAGGSQWQAIVGGALNTSMSVTAPGANYIVPPLVLISAPPSPGVPATAVAAIASGTVSSITVINQGAGYSVAPSITVLPSPYDPNYGVITNASVTATLTGSGQVTAVLCTNNGAPVTAVPTLTIAGGNGSATATATICWTGTALALTTAGGGYALTGVLVTIAGGLPTAVPVWTNPATEVNLLPVRPPRLSASSNGTVSAAATIMDGGLFARANPVAIFSVNGVLTTVAVGNITSGNTSDTSIIQPL
jgi:hypothetical protein